MWRASVLTLFPEMFPGPLGVSLIGKALSDGLWALDVHDIRNSGIGRHRSVDDTPAGGGPGMVMRADVAAVALDSVMSGGGPSRPVICLSPRGMPLLQERVRELSEGPGAILFCARFEGLDERVIQSRKMEEVSLGDFVLAGGEVPAMALIEACARLIPGVLGKDESSLEESFEQGLLEYPQFTRPQSFEGADIPPVLLSGDHAAIRRWRKDQAERLTRLRRPDLWTLYEKRVLSARRPAAPPKEPPDGGKT
jgi:tRNA (guanine37-N1)-methyltransferase